MDELLADIVAHLRTEGSIDAAALDRIIARRNRQEAAPVRAFSKKQLLGGLERMRLERPGRWRELALSPEELRALHEAFRMKPRRTASGVATVTVIMKPAPCRGDCVFCPTAPGMPKSYLPDEPACQRAAAARFDPFEQVTRRLRTLAAMGHATDKVELIVLGGTFLDYPQGYRTWFVRELFRALCELDAEAGADLRGLALEELHRRNETARHRCVGLVVETRPDTVTPRALSHLRQLGCTKVQLGVQSLDAGLLARNGRTCDPAQVERAFELLRAFGFKSHVHFMANLVGATPESDRADYLRLVRDERFLPDEVKLYPCVLVAGSRLERLWREGAWQPYSDGQLVELMAHDLAATPAYTRVSRMVRDFSRGDILAGSTRANLRQLVDERLAHEGVAVAEMRSREVAGRDVDLACLELTCAAYRTSNTDERFLQWTTPEGLLAGFARLSLPHRSYVEAHAEELPVLPGEAMIREVHVYGRAARVGAGAENAQHAGLGGKLVEEACRLAREAGYHAVNVISAVGTRGYYRARGFADSGLYLRRPL